MGDKVASRGASGGGGQGRGGMGVHVPSTKLYLSTLLKTDQYPVQSKRKRKSQTQATRNGGDRGGSSGLGQGVWLESFTV